VICMGNLSFNKSNLINDNFVELSEPNYSDFNFNNNKDKIRNTFIHKLPSWAVLTHGLRPQGLTLSNLTESATLPTPRKHL